MADSLKYPTPASHRPAGAVVVFSGGQDSTTCLDWARTHFTGPIHALTIDYGQRHQREIKAAEEVVAFMSEDDEITHKIIAVPDVLLGTSPLVNKNEDLEQYADFNSLPGGLEKTFVPMRNQFFLTIAANYAYVNGIDTLVTGVCQEDFGGYPDCRRAFIDLLTDAINAGTFNREGGFPMGITIETPLMHLTKAESVWLAMSLPKAYPALALSHTAYDGAYPPTGHDHATLLRAKGFHQAGVPDPLVLKAVRDDLMEMPESEEYSESTIETIINQFPDLRRLI